jgi:bifunctional non-homologous end joining protein LigD
VHSILIAFDCLNVDGADLRRLTLEARRDRLEVLLASAGRKVAEAIWFLVAVQGREIESLYRNACALGIEGIVANRLAAGYKSGPSRAWRKVLCEGYERPGEGG